MVKLFAQADAIPSADVWAQWGLGGAALGATLFILYRITTVIIPKMQEKHDESMKSEREICSEERQANGDRMERISDSFCEALEKQGDTLGDIRDSLARLPMNGGS